MAAAATRRLAVALTALGFLCACARADHDYFPVKSLGTPWPVRSYAGYASQVDDMHPVHGAALTRGALAGGAAVVGKGIGPVGFLTVVGAGGEAVWTWTQSGRGSRVLNAVLELPDSGLLVAAGYERAEAPGGRFALKRSVYLIDPTSARAGDCLVWSSASFGDAPGANGAWEMLELSADGRSVFLSGVSRAPDWARGEFYFKRSAPPRRDVPGRAHPARVCRGVPTRLTHAGAAPLRSYGNVPAGTATVMELPVAAFARSAAPPTQADALWTHEWTGAADAHMAAKSVRALTSGRVAVLAWDGTRRHGAQRGRRRCRGPGARADGPHDARALRPSPRPRPLPQTRTTPGRRPSPASAAGPAAAGPCSGSAASGSSTARRRTWPSTARTPSPSAGTARARRTRGCRRG